VIVLGWRAAGQTVECLGSVFAGGPGVGRVVVVDNGSDDGADTVGLTSGASEPESIVNDVVTWFKTLGVATVDTVMVVDEDVEFSLPANLARKLQAS
jgi:4-hydroxy-3-methylbut-2-enyl diphosphate reductase